MPERTIETEIAVVGAGIAGLTAASTLAEEGVDVSCSRRATGSAGGPGTPRSAARRTSSAGSGSRPTSPRCTRCWTSSRSSCSRASARASTSTSIPPGPSTATAATTRRSAAPRTSAFEAADAKLDALAKELDPEAPWDHPDAAELDAITFESWLRAEVDDDMARDLLRSWLAGGFLAKPAQTFSLLQGMWMISGAGGTFELFEPDQCLAYRVVGGSQLISIRLAERLGERVVLGAPARDIRWSDDGVEIDAESVRVTARQVIVAVPPNLTTAIRFRPALPAWRMRMAQALSQGSIIKVLAVYEQPFWREEGLSGQGFAPYELVRELYDNSPPSASAGVLTTFLAGENAEEAERMSATTRRDAVLEGIAKYVGARGAASRSTSSRPCGRPRSGPAARTGPATASAGLTRFGEDLRRPIGPIHWACTDIAGLGHIHMEGATRSGERAARACLEAVPA